MKKEENKEKTYTFKERLRELLPYVIIIIVVILIRTFLFTPIKVNGTSMYSTLDHGDTMILNKIGMKISGIERFDIVVIKTRDSYIIKRVIGLPGERIEYKEGKLYINGKVMKDPYYKNNTLDFKNIKIPNNHYYVLGDNRANSIDSRIIGPVLKDDIMGTTKLIFFPIKNIGLAK